MADTSSQLVWVDLEMTGLDAQTCAIVEIATIITDGELENAIEGPTFVIHPGEEALATMIPFVRDLHTKSGLLERIHASTTTLAEAEAATVAFVQSHCPKGTAVLAGNSIYKDREFLTAYMPRMLEWLHYRMIDVSTIKELVRRWYPAPYQAPKKREVHRALDDIRESIAELQWYRGKVFARPDAG